MIKWPTEQNKKNNKWRERCSLHVWPRSDDKTHVGALFYHSFGRICCWAYTGADKLNFWVVAPSERYILRTNTWQNIPFDMIYVSLVTNYRTTWPLIAKYRFRIDLTQLNGKLICPLELIYLDFCRPTWPISPVFACYSFFILFLLKNFVQSFIALYYLASLTGVFLHFGFLLFNKYFHFLLTSNNKNNWHTREQKRSSETAKMYQSKWKKRRHIVRKWWEKNTKSKQKRTTKTPLFRY